MWTPISAFDRLTLSFLALLTAVILLFISLIPAWPQLIVKNSLLALAIISFASLRRRDPRSRLYNFTHALLPIVSVLVIFNSLGDIIPFIRKHYYDDVLIRIDYMFFATYPTVWLERFNNAFLTSLFQVAYISYYCIPIALGISLFIKDKKDEFEIAVFAVLLCFYLSYIGYILFPAVGPRFTLNHKQTMDLQAGPMTLWIQQTLDTLEHNKTDAFPSGHTAVALVSFYYAWAYGEKMLFRILVPTVSALVISTVYLRYHCVIDVVAGIMLAVLTILISPRIYRLFAGTS